MLAQSDCALRVFVSYSHKDQSSRARLEEALACLVREGKLALWTDHCISAGAVLDDKIAAALAEADLVLMLVSPGFLASDYCQSVELQAALKRHTAGTVVIVPIVVRPCEWQSTQLSKLKAIPDDGKPISRWKNTDQAWLSVTTSLRVLTTELFGREKVAAKPLLDTRHYLRQEFERIRGRYEGRGALPPGTLSSGLSLLDEMLDGLHQGSLTVFGSRPRVGASALALAAAVRNALRGKKVLYITPRCPAGELIRRAICQLTRVNPVRMKTGLLEDEDWTRLSHGITLLAEAALFIDDIRSVEGARLGDYILQRLDGEVFDLIVIEGLDFFVSTTASGDAAREASLVSKSLRTIAQKHRCSVAVSLDLGPRIDNRSNRRPMLFDLGAWHDLQQEADHVVFAYRDGFYDSDAAKNQELELHVLLNRGGDTGIVGVDFFCETETIIEPDRNESGDKAEKGVEKGVRFTST